MIGSVAMLLEMSCGLKEEANLVWQAMKHVFEAGYTTADLQSVDASKTVTTDTFGDLVMATLSEKLAANK